MIIHDLYESPQLCPECGGVSFSNLILAEKKDACYYKVKASAKVWPSAYASGRLVQCRKKGAGNYGNKSEGVAEGSRTPQDWEVKSAVWGLDKRGVHQEPQNIKSHFVRADRSSRAEEKAKREYEPGRGTWEIHPRGNKQQGVAEGLNDTIYPNAEVIKSKNGKPVGEIYQDGNSWGAFHYRADRGYDFIDSREEAIEALKDLHQETGRSRPDYTVKGVTEMDKSQTPPGRDGSNDSDAGKKEYSAKATTPKKVAKHGEKILNKLMDKSYKQDKLDEKSVSQAQFRTMAAAAHNPEFARKVGIKQSVAREFNKADKGSNYKKLPARTTEGAPVTTTPGSINPGGAVDNFKQQMANNTEVAYQKKLSGVGEGEQQKGADYRDPPEADYGNDYQDMVARVKKLAGLGPLKTVYDPNKRVYRNVPTAVQPKK